jgi:alpha-galactosidase
MFSLPYLQRYSMATHWIAAGANLITGSDMTRLDPLGSKLLSDPEALAVADFCAQFPIQPRNPLGWGKEGGNAARQAQAWIAGPDDKGVAIVVLSNYGPDPCLKVKNHCTPTYALDWGGVHNVSISLAELGLGTTNAPFGGSAWDVRRIWGGGGHGGPDHTDIGQWTERAECLLGPGESALYKLMRATR